jgi:hypothetical protein
LTNEPLVDSRSIRKGLTPDVSSPYSLRVLISLNWRTACCLEHEGWASGTSTICRGKGPSRASATRLRRREGDQKHAQRCHDPQGRPIDDAAGTALLGDRVRRPSVSQGRAPRGVTELRIGTRSRTDLLLALEDVKPPVERRLACLGRLIVLEDRTRGRHVGLCCERTGARISLRSDQKGKRDARHKLELEPRRCYTHPEAWKLGSTGFGGGGRSSNTGPP